jgi:hypothetical protein
MQLCRSSSWLNLDTPGEKLWDLWGEESGIIPALENIWAWADLSLQFWGDIWEHYLVDSL